MGKRTVFYEDIKNMDPFIADFGGWDMPIYFTGIKDEHFAVRNDVGVFDVSHMVFFSLKGEKVIDFLNKVTTINFYKKQDANAVYSVLCNEAGGIVDDIIVYKKNAIEVYIIANAGHEEKVGNWLSKWNNFDVNIKLEKKAILAIQGPKSAEIIKQIFSKIYSSEILNLKYYNFCEIDDIIVARTGYTGEIGFEIIMPENSENIFKIWDDLKKLNVKICGLGARDILRLEAGYPLYGHELSDEISPIDAGLNWILDFQKEDFVGKHALLEQKQKGISKKLVGLEFLDRRFIPRNNNEIFLNNEKIGYVTSGSYSFFLDKAIALAYVDAKYANVGDKVQVLIRNKMVDAEVRNTRFYYNSQVKEKF